MISKTNIIRLLSLIPGWHTNRKIVVIESDDWGSIRTKDKRSLEILSKNYPHFLKDAYTRYDSLETANDLNALIDVLNSVKDIHGNPAIITANTIMANPDFLRIKASDYKDYFYKPIDESGFYKNDELNIITQAIANKVYQPQLHGREHLNINAWLKELQNGQSDLRAAFEHEMFGIPIIQENTKRKNIMAALDFESSQEIEFQKTIITDAQQIFNRVFGFNSTTFIAPSYIWHPELEVHLKLIGIKALQGLPYNYIPNPNGEWYKTKFRYTGKKSKSGLINIVRNAFFEPSLTKQNVIPECMNRINFAFNMKKPAIIGSHRLNFMGGMDETNRKKNLGQLHQLLKSIINKWPNVEFMSSDKLLQVIQNKN